MSPVGPPAPGARHRRIETTCLASVAPERVRWLWTDRIPLGKVSSISGDPGLGKSTVATDLAARVSTGSPFPGETHGRQPASGVMLAIEDDLSCTVRPRLDAAGADASRVHAIDGNAACRFRMPRDVQSLAALVVDLGARLVVVDPLMAYLSGDSHKDADVRQALHPLVNLARDTQCAVVLVRHLNKGSGAAIHRGGGSIGIVGVVRSELLVGIDPEDKDARILASVKSNLGPPSLSIRFGFDSAPGGQARLRWGEECDLRADDLLAPRDSGKKNTKIDSAKAFLRDQLADGPAYVRDLYANAEALGLHKQTLKRARVQLGLPKPIKSPDGPWVWPSFQGDQGE